MPLAQNREQTPMSHRRDFIKLSLSAALAGSMALSAVPAFAQMVTCDVVGTRRGRTIGACKIDNTLISERILDPEAIQLGLSWR